MHRAAFAHRRPQAFTHRSFYTYALHRKVFAQRSLQSIYTHKSFTHTHKSFTHTPLHTDAFTHRSLFTEQGLHRAAFTHRSFYTERGLCTEQLIQSYTHRSLDRSLHIVAVTQKFFTQMRQMLLHTEAFEHRCLPTQKHLPRDALAYTRLCTQKPLDTDCFSETHRSFDTKKPLHGESFTHRSFYTHKLFHRSFYTEKFLSTGAFTHRRLYTQKLVHGGFLAQKLLHRAAFTHFQKSQLRKIFDVRPSYRAKGLHPALENRDFWRWTIILREGVAPDLVKSQF